MYVTLNKRSIYFIIFVVSLILIFFVEGIFIKDSNHNVDSAKNGCLDFLEEKGIEVDVSSCEIKKIKIPEKFNDVYSKYNDLQRKAGYDLSDYCGKTVEKYTYKVINHNGDDTVFVNLLVLADKIIGGDITNNVINGFIKPLK